MRVLQAQNTYKNGSQLIVRKSTDIERLTTAMQPRPTQYTVHNNNKKITEGLI